MKISFVECVILNLFYDVKIMLESSSLHVSYYEHWHDLGPSPSSSIPDPFSPYLKDILYY